MKPVASTGVAKRMSGWSILVSILASLSGAVLFLQLAAAGVAGVNANLRAYNEHTVKIHKRRLEELCASTTGEAEVPTVAPVAGEPEG